MLIQELFKKLSEGELSNLSMSNDANGTIKETSWSKLIGYTNDALLRLHTRFVLSEKTLLLLQVGHITTYHLLRQFSEASGSMENFKYIKDLENEPYEEDLIRVLSITNHFGDKIPLNEENNPHSIFTPRFDQLYIPYPVDNAPIGVTYQAKPPTLKTSGRGILRQEVPIPFFFEEAVKAFVAAKVFSHINGQENTIKSTEHAATYETLCVNTETLDLVNQTSTQFNNRFEAKGFI